MVRIIWSGWSNNTRMEKNGGNEGQVVVDRARIRMRDYIYGVLPSVDGVIYFFRQLSVI